MNNIFNINESEKNRIKEMHLNELTKPGTGMNEQTVDQVDTLTHHEFMGKVDEYCIKIKGNKRLRNWSDTEQWVRAYCNGK